MYLTLILVDSAKSHEFKISPKVNILAQSAEKFQINNLKTIQLSVTEITRHVWNNWPDEWAEERVERPDILRLIFQVTIYYTNLII